MKERVHLSVDFIVPRYFFLNWVFSVMGRSSQLNVSCDFVLLNIQYMEKKNPLPCTIMSYLCLYVAQIPILHL